MKIHRVQRNDGITNSVMSTPDWSVVRECLGDELLAGLVGMSQRDLERYASRSHPPAPVIVERLRWLQAVIEDLKGGYSPMGIRTWFERPRSQLAGRSPRQVLGESWSTDDEAAQRVRALAAEVSGRPAQPTRT